MLKNLHGPKVSSLKARASLGTSIKMVGSIYLVKPDKRFPPVTTLAPFLRASAICSST